MKWLNLPFLVFYSLLHCFWMCRLCSSLYDAESKGMYTTLSTTLKPENRPKIGYVSVEKWLFLHRFIMRYRLKYDMVRTSYKPSNRREWGAHHMHRICMWVMTEKESMWNIINKLWTPGENVSLCTALCVCCVSALCKSAYMCNSRYSWNFFTLINWTGSYNNSKQQASVQWSNILWWSGMKFQQLTNDENLLQSQPYSIYIQTTRYSFKSIGHALNCKNSWPAWGKLPGVQYK